MTRNKLKIMLSFMRELNDDNIPCAEDYEITEKEFCNILQACQDEGYIKNALFPSADDEQFSFLENVRLTASGMEYLNKNSKIMQTYKGLKEIRSWLPF